MKRHTTAIFPAMPAPLARHEAGTTQASGFRRLVCAALLSLALYAVLFGAVLDRPLELGFLAHELDARLARAATIHGPKLVILAGSNGPYSHRCEVIEPMLDLPCVNGGVAVGIGLDYLFTRWRGQLHPGDVVYLPMEQQQYTASRLATALGPDAAIMFRHDWTTLAALSPKRWVAALFAFDLRAGLMSLIEMSLVAVRFHDPRAEASGTSNAWGDHVGHTASRGAESQAVLTAMMSPPTSAASIRNGYGAYLIAEFVTWARAHGVRVIGGLPTELALTPRPDLPHPEVLRPGTLRPGTLRLGTSPPMTRLAAIEAVYLRHGGEFLVLPNRSRYPSAAFFDTPLHLNEACQIAHSITLARALAPLLGRIARAPPAALAVPPPECPGIAKATALAQGPR